MTEVRRRGRPGQAEPVAQKGAQALERGIAILQYLEKSGGSSSVSDISLNLDLPLSTTFRLLKVLQAADFVYQDSQLGWWHIGLGVFNVGAAYIHNRDVLSVAGPFMRRLMLLSGETVNVAIRNGNEAVLIGQLECKSMVRMCAPLGDAEIALTREQLGWKYAPFEIPSEIYAQWDAKEAGQAKESAWNEKFAAYAKAYPQEAAEFTRRMKGEMPSDFDAKAKEFIAKLQANPAKIASRKASQNAIEAFGPLLPEFLGGSADLAPSNLTLWSGSKAINEDAAGNYIHYGVREFGMTAIANGISLHGGFLPYTSTFLMFVEYARNAVRMAALMKQRQVMVYTHDSIGLGEDGPTHQPVEQIASLRVTPNMSTWRPCDQVESAVAWKYGVERQDGPTALILSRQNLAQQERTEEQLANIARGGYVLKDCAGQPELIFIATGSEVELAVAAYEKLTAEGVKARVVSMPSTDAFDKQDAAYRESVLPKAVTARVAVEAGIADYWYKYVGLNGAIVGMTTFGESAPAEQLFEEFGFTVDNVVAKAKALL